MRGGARPLRWLANQRAEFVAWILGHSYRTQDVVRVCMQTD